MSIENVLYIKQGRYTSRYFGIVAFEEGLIYGDRHPLQEQVVDAFVPNGILLVGGGGNGSCAVVDDDMEHVEGTLMGNSVMICTGANACGKSVYLKQVGGILSTFLRPDYTFVDRSL